MKAMKQTLPEDELEGNDIVPTPPKVPLSPSTRSKMLSASKEIPELNHDGVVPRRSRRIGYLEKT
jgi:hypothetical protein